MEEIWKTVEATKGHYEVSNLGNVRKDGEIVEPHEDANGYMKVKIVLCMPAKKNEQSFKAWMDISLQRKITHY